MTKAEYNKAHKALLQRQTEIVAKLADADATNGGSLWTPEMIAESEIFTAWNDLHDAECDIANEIFDLDSAWNTRNWTVGDWNSYTLVTANVD